MKKILSASLAIFLSLAVLVTFTPLTETAYGASKLKAPKNVTAVADKGDRAVTLSWDAVKGAKSYKVYQKSGKKYVPVDVVNDTDDHGDLVTEYVVEGLDKNTTYTFKVRAGKKETGHSLGKYSSAVKANISESFNNDKKMKNAANNLFAESKSAQKRCLEIADQLAYNPKYWDSNEGWRTAGSDAEHRAARYLKDEWEKIGLEDVTLDKVKLDKFQFNDAKLTVKDGEGKNIVTLGSDKKVEDEATSIISYAVNGTKQRIKREKLSADFYDNMPIVYMGEGGLANYNAYYDLTGDTNMNGKIVLVGIDQYNSVWITQAYNEAFTQGAEGVISYQVKGGYATYDGDTNHVQDVCSDDLGIPCTGISRNNGEKIKKSMPYIENIMAYSDYIDEYNCVTEEEQEPSGADMQVEETWDLQGSFPKGNLFVDSEVVDDGGYTYNVVGKISGTGDTGQQLLYAGHYDKYFYGYEDDCMAVGLVAGVAKAMVDSGYEPENDIYFIAHGAEEWGQIGTDYDWAIGSWEEITSAHPEWQGTTLALFNFEMPGIAGKQIILSDEENANFANAVLASGIYDNACFDTDEFYARSSNAGFTKSDNISYSDNGVPSYMNWSYNYPWSQARYHTNRDKSPWRGDSDDAEFVTEQMQKHIEMWGGLGIAQDMTPSLNLDITARCDLLDEAMTDETAVTSSQEKAYNKAVKALYKKADSFYADGVDINADYDKACLAGDVAGMEAAKKAALKHNKKDLAAYKALQEGTVAIEMGGLTTEVAHTIPQANYELLNTTVDCLEDGDYAGALSASAGLNGYFDWAYGWTCSVDTLNRMQKTFTNDYDNWGKTVELTGKLSKEWITSHKLFFAAVFKQPPGTNLVKDFETHADNNEALVQKLVKSETKAINKVVKGL